jgi:mannosyltransferase
MNSTKTYKENVPIEWKWIIIIIIGALLRFYSLDKQSLWLDEMTTIQVSSESIDKILSGKIFDNATPPLYYVIMHYWSKIIPLTEFGVRIPSVLFDLMNMVLILIISRKFTSIKNTPFILGAYALSPFMIYYSQEGRMYTLLLLFALMFSYSMIKIVLKEGNIYLWTLLSGLMFAGGIYTHYYMMFYAFGVYLLCIYIVRKSLNGIVAVITSGLIGIILFIPWLPIVINLTGSGAQSFRKYTLTVIPYAIFRFVVGYAIFPVNMFTKDNFIDEVIKHSMEILAVYVSVLFLIYELKKSSNKGNRKIILVLSWVISIPVIISTLISIKSPMLSERYLIIILPFLFIMFFGLINISKPWGFVSITILYILMIIGDYYYYLNPQFGKAQWRDVGRYVSKSISAGDIIIIEPDYVMPIFRYYFHGEQKTYPVYPFDSKNATRNIDISRLHKDSRLFLIRSGSKTNTNYAKYLEKYANMTFSYNFPLETGINCSIWQLN